MLSQMVDDAESRGGPCCQVVDDAESREGQVDSRGGGGRDRRSSKLFAHGRAEVG